MRVLVVDDHEVVRRGIRSFLAAYDIEVCGEAVDGRDAVLKAQELKPDVITMDITMPVLNGIEATREIRRVLPEAKVLVLSQHDTPSIVRQALHSGASGYIVKTAVADNIITALERIAQGGTFFNPSVFAEDVGTVGTQEVLQLVANHLSAAVTRCTRDLRYVWANQGYANWLGRPLREIIGRPIEEVIGKEAFEALKPHFGRVLAGEKVRYEQQVEFRGIGPRWIAAIYTPTLDSTGSPDGWVAVIQDITERKQNEEALQKSEAQLVVEATALAKLNDLSSRLWSTRTLQDGLNEMLRAAIELMGADKGNVQLLDSRRNVLTIVAQHGFQQDFLEFFHEVSAADDCACGRALRCHKPVVIEDTEGDEGYAPFRPVARRAEYRAVASVPLVGSNGFPLGMLSTHFRSVQCPTDESLRRLTLYARQAAGFIERCRVEADLFAAQAQLEQKVQNRTQELTKANEEAQRLSARLLRTQDEERRRIARDLHDGVGQLLAVMSMNIATISQEKSKLSARAATCVTENAETIERVSTEIRTITHLLHLPLLDQVGLKSALEELVTGFSERSNIRVTLDLPQTLRRLPPESELSLLRIAQECLTNVHRHSGSSTALVRLSETNGRLELEVSDDGRGMSEEIQSRAQRGEGRGLGLRGMRERVAMIGGSLDIRSGPKGTSIRLFVPLAEQEGLSQSQVASI